MGVLVTSLNEFEWSVPGVEEENIAVENWSIIDHKVLPQISLAIHQQ